MSGEIFPKIEFNPPLQLGKGEHLKCSYLLVVTMIYLKYMGHALTRFRIMYNAMLNIYGNSFYSTHKRI